MTKSTYSDLARELAEGIACGRLGVGSLLPTEFELCEQHGLSRYAVRKALDELQEMGLISRRKNVGTRVEAARPAAGFSQSIATVEELAQFGARTVRVIQSTQAVVADLARHLGTPAETALRTVLGWDPAQDPSGAATGLIELYRTDITRHRARVTVGAGTPYEGVVELALDLGHIHAGELNVTVRELEIESISGHPMAVIEASRDWVRRHGVWLDTQTKAHRGDRLDLLDHLQR